MQKFYIVVFLSLSILGCKPYQSTKIIPGQLTYEAFRKQQKSFQSEDGIIKYIDKGEGPAIVLLHGVPTSGWMYRKMIDPLVAGGYRVIIPDMLGYGSSDSPDGYELYNEKNHAKRLLALMDRLGIEYWSHVMHDAGGLWTWEVFDQAPERIEDLVLLNTIIYEDGFYPPIPMKAGFFAKTSMWAYRNGMTTNTLLRNLFKHGLKKNTLNKIDIEGYRKPLLEGKTKGMYYFFTQTCSDFPDYIDTYDAIKIPVNVIWGIHDTMLQWTPQQIRVMETFNLTKEDVNLIDEKHFIQETKAQKVSKLILYFLS